MTELRKFNSTVSLFRKIIIEKTSAAVVKYFLKECDSLQYEEFLREFKANSIEEALENIIYHKVDLLSLKKINFRLYAYINEQLNSAIFNVRCLKDIKVVNIIMTAAIKTGSFSDFQRLLNDSSLTAQLPKRIRNQLSGLTHFSYNSLNTVKQIDGYKKINDRVNSYIASIATAAY